MSSSRNKRKRNENDPTTMATASRRRSRESRAAVDAALAVAGSQKNETEDKPNAGDDSGAVVMDVDDKSSMKKDEDGSELTTAGNDDIAALNVSKPINDQAKRTGDADPGTGSSQNASTSKQPLHVVAEAENEVSNSSKDDPDPDSDDRQALLRKLISHRTMLLSRIRLCRNAAKKRLDDTRMVATQHTGDKQQNSGVHVREITDDEEIQTHKDMTKIASQAAKKARGEGNGAAEKRTSLSLRRGSSVGKRMNAALSSLAPGVVPPTGAGAAVAPVTVPSASISAGKTLPTGSAINTSTPVPPVHLVAQENVPTAGMSQVPGLASAKNAKAMPGHAVPRQPPGGADGKQSRPSVGKSLKPNATAVYRANSNAKADQNPAAFRPVQPYPSTSTRLPQSKTIFTEAMALRKRRDNLQAKLKSLLDRQKVRNGDLDSFRRNAGAVSKNSRFSVDTSSDIGPRSDLPRRRKTHWDRLLQEMNWLATDFIEERKWKMSSARALSSSILSSGMSIGSIAATRKSSAAMATEAELETVKEAKDVHSESSGNSSVPLRERKYLKPSLDDVKASRKVGRLTSCMISELEIAIRESGSMGDTDEFYLKALERYKSFRTKLLNGTAGTTDESLQLNSDNLQCNDVEMDVEDSVGQDSTTQDNTGELTFSEISQRISKLGAFDGEKTTMSVKELSPAVIGKKLNLSAAQTGMVEFVDRIWALSTAGAMLSGLPTSGKTVAACSVMWKHRLDGPHLVICPPASLLRWKYEVSLFRDFRVLDYGFVCGIASPLRGLLMEDVEPGPGDVVICEYSSVWRIMDQMRDKAIDFNVFCIDCRHPEGMFGSIGSIKSKVMKKAEWHGSQEIVTTDWWEQVMILAKRDSTKRMIIDFCDPDHYSLSRTGLEPRQQLEIMSLRTAFLIGPRIFYPSNYALSRTVISWARHRDKKPGEDKFHRVQRVLEETLAPFSMCSRETLPFPSPSIWSIRLCRMPHAQREAYDSCCSHIRGALASSLDDANTQEDLGSTTYQAIAAALFRLRKICLTASSMERAEQNAGNSSNSLVPFVSTEPCTADATPTEAGPFKISSDNSSQPDSELAEVLLKNSAKLLELIYILKNDCGYVPDCDDYVAGLIQPPGNGKSNDRGSRKKVVILADLPRTQWLVSILLGSVGIRHKLVRREFSYRHTKMDDAIKHNQAALAWAESQNTLIAFNAESEAQGKLGVYDSAGILIVSPDSLASWHGGVGIDNADIVISLDEDWSGREMGILEASVSRWNACASMKRSPGKMIRLLCENTIEEKLFENLGKTAFSASFEWPLDSSGNHLFSMGVEELLPIYSQSQLSRPNTILPGSRLLRLRGEPLEEVLLTSNDLEPLFGTGSSMTFLPLGRQSAAGRKSSEEIERELLFLRSLFDLECSEASKDLNESSADSIAFTVEHHFGSGVLPPQPQKFPEHMMSRSDLKFLTIRYYFERQADISRQNSFHVGGMALPKLSESARVISSTSGQTTEVAVKDEFALADAWQKSGLGSKPDEMADTLLSYSVSEHPEQQDPLISGSNARFNVYSRLYSTSWDDDSARDGSQGFEPVVFFPPVYPKIQVAPAASQESPPLISAEEQSSGTIQQPDLSNGSVNPGVLSKRKGPNSSPPADENPKKPRIESATAPSELQKNGNSTLNMISAEVAENQTTDDNNAQGNRIEKLTAASLVVDSPAGPSAIPAGEEDYGLLGRGDLPLAADSSLLLANESTRVGGIHSSPDFIQDYLPCDPEEAGLSLPLYEDPLQLIAVFVKLRPQNPLPTRDTHSQYRPHSAFDQTDQRRTNTHATPVTNPLPAVAAAHDMNGDDAGKKMRRKAGGQTTHSAFTSFSGPGQNRPNPATSTLYANGKDGDRHRMLATYASRKFGTGLSMFESASFRVAMVQVQSRVRTRLDRTQNKAFLSSEVGPGLSLHALNQPNLIREVERGVVHFTSIVETLKKESQTGDAAKALATSQRSALRRSMVAPFRVDFGPFSGGFLSSPSGMTGISPPRSRLGVSLPMGVKVTQGFSDIVQPNWTPEEDKLLQEAAVRFGMNWIIVARSLSGFEGFVVTDTNIRGQARRRSSSARSARHCRDRWQSLAKNQPSLASEVRKSEKILRENALKRARSIVNEQTASTPSALSLPTSSDVAKVLLTKELLYKKTEQQDDKMEIDTEAAKQELTTNDDSSQNQMNKRRRSFSVLKASMGARRVIPLTIPGVPPGSQPHQPVPSHPSHMQSVQSSVAAKWSNGRTEMWPLQILDCTDKHRAATRSSAQRTSIKQAAASAGSPPSTRQPISGNSTQPSSQRSASSSKWSPTLAAPPNSSSPNRQPTQRSTPTPPTGSASPKRSKPASDGTLKSSSSSVKKADESKA